MVGILKEERREDSVDSVAQGLFDRIKSKVNSSALDKAYQVCVYIASQYVNDIPLNPEQFIEKYHVDLDTELFSFV